MKIAAKQLNGLMIVKLGTFDKYFAPVIVNNGSLDNGVTLNGMKHIKTYKIIIGLFNATENNKIDVANIAKTYIDVLIVIMTKIKNIK